MAALVGQHQITTFVSPVNGTAPIDANTVRGNDNTIKTAYDAHDSDATIHIQSSSLAARPAAGTAGSIWFTSDGFRLYYDNGSAWTEAAYLPTAGGTVAGNVLITGTLGVTGVVTASTGLVVTTGGLTVSSGTTAVQALTSALGITATGTAAQIGAFYALTATTTSIAWQAGNNTGNGFKWIQDESVTGNAMLVRINAGVDATMMTFTRATGLVTFAAGLTVTTGGLTVSSGTTAVQALTATTGVFAGAVSGITTLAIGGALTGVTTLAMGGALSGVTTVNASGLATLSAGISLTGTLTFLTAASKIVPGATSLVIRDGTDAATNFTFANNGNFTAAGTITAPVFTISAAGSSGLLIASLSSFSNGAGAGGGTLTNAPSAGNPTKWIGINDNGTTRYFPCW